MRMTNLKAITKSNNTERYVKVHFTKLWNEIIYPSPKIEIRTELMDACPDTETSIKRQQMVTKILNN